MGDFPATHPTIGHHGPWGFSKVITSWSSRRPAQVRRIDGKDMRKSYEFDGLGPALNLGCCECDSEFPFAKWRCPMWREAPVETLGLRSVFRGSQRHRQVMPAVGALHHLHRWKTILRSTSKSWRCWGRIYPLVMTNIAMESHHSWWENSLFLRPFSMAMLNYQRVSTSPAEWREMWDMEFHQSCAKWSNTTIAVCLPSESCTASLWPYQNPTLINHSATFFWCRVYPSMGYVPTLQFWWESIFRQSHFAILDLCSHVPNSQAHNASKNSD